MKKTPLFEKHQQLGARIVPFAGYDMPVQYTSVMNETLGCRKAAGLFDVSHMGQVRVKGKDALSALQKLVTNDLSKLKDGQAQYNLLCNQEGGVIDDLIVYRISEDHWYICVNASNRDKDFAWMKKELPHTLSLVDESDETGLIAIQGPKAEEIVSKICDPRVAKNLKYYWGIDADLAGKRVFISRTGYTGEDGFEIYCKTDDTLFLWDALTEAGTPFEIIPVGLGARDTLRTEMGYPLHGHELSETLNGYEAGLGWVIKLAKREFNGRTALEKIKVEGPSKKLLAFKTVDRRIPRTGYPILDATGNKVGEITSGTQSPHLNCPIALGFVNSNSGNAFRVQVRNETIPVDVCTLPFLPSKVKK